MKIKSYSYSKGVKNPAKSLSSFAQINEISIEEPQYVRIPIKQIRGVAPIVVVTQGDKVKRGTRIAVSGDKVILSSVSGVVEEIAEDSSVYGGKTQVVVIKNDGKDTQEVFKKYDETSTAEQFSIALKRLSIVDYDGVELSSKVDAISNSIDRTLVVNLLTDEPYELNTAFLISKQAEDVAKGVVVMATLSKASNVIVAVKKGDEKLYAEWLKLIEQVGSTINFSVAIVPNVYPIGDELELTRTLTKKKLESIVDVREIGFISVGAFAIYALKKLIIDGEVVDKRPLSIIEVTNKEIQTTMAWVKLGATIEDVFNSMYLNGVSGIKKIVAGGPMRVIALVDEKAGITFNLKAVMAFRTRVADTKPELQCITCGKCSKICPQGLVPYEIDENTINNDFNEAVKCGADKCTRCGVCSYICPSKRHLTQRIYYAKEIINNKGLRNE